MGNVEVKWTTTSDPVVLAEHLAGACELDLYRLAKEVADAGGDVMETLDELGKELLELVDEVELAANELATADAEDRAPEWNVLERFAAAVQDRRKKAVA